MKTKSSDGECSKNAKSNGGLTTEIRLSEKGEMNGKGPCTKHVKVPFFAGTTLGVGLPLREKLVGIANVYQQIK